MQKLLLVIGQLGSGGSERQLTTFATSLDPARFEVHVAVWNPSDEDRYPKLLKAKGVRVHPLSGRGGVPAKMLRLRRLVRELRPDIVHSYSFFTNWPTQAASHALAPVLVGSIRGDFDRVRREAGMIPGRLNARWPEVQISNSQGSRDLAEADPSWFVPGECRVIPNGIDMLRFPPPVPPSAGMHIVGVGGLIPVKRWDRLIDAAATLHRRGYPVRVTVCGTGRLRGDLTERIRSRGLESSFRLAGRVDDVESMFASANVVAHTADSEGCPNAVLEAMAAGRPVVATAVGEVPYIVRDGETGFVVPREHLATLADRLQQLLLDPDLAVRMGRAARAHVEAYHSIDKLIVDTLDAYRSAGWRG